MICADTAHQLQENLLALHLLCPVLSCVLRQLLASQKLPYVICTCIYLLR